MSRLFHFAKVIIAPFGGRIFLQTFVRMLRPTAFSSRYMWRPNGIHKILPVSFAGYMPSLNVTAAQRGRRAGMAGPGRRCGGAIGDSEVSLSRSIRHKPASARSSRMRRAVSQARWTTPNGATVTRFSHRTACVSTANALVASGRGL